MCAAGGRHGRPREQSQGELSSASNALLSSAPRPPSLLLAQDVNVKVIAEMVGHADVRVTLRVYAHLMPSAQREAPDAMDQPFVAQWGGV